MSVPEDDDEVAADRELVGVVEEAVAAAERRAGPRLDYQACPACCMGGPFPITAVDARRLARGLAALAVRDPERARAVRDRAEAAVAQMTADFPGDAVTGILGGDAQGEERFLEAHSHRTCPVLDPRTGRCELYEWRPLICRTFGLPARIDGQDLPSCSLCFKAESPDEVEACRLAPGYEPLEDALLDRLEARGEPSRETVIAFALSEPARE